jgi:hypothetical protein
LGRGHDWKNPLVNVLSMHWTFLPTRVSHSLPPSLYFH